MHQNKNQNIKHEPVLLNEVIKYLDPKPNQSFLDLTAGYGGHALAVAGMTGSLIRMVLVDRDINAVNYLKTIFKSTVLIKNVNFYDASLELEENGSKFDLILADLGVSSPHLNERERGFSISLNGPLDMRMDQTQALSANVVVNNYSEKKLIGILKQYGEEKLANKIAKAIVTHRPVKSTSELAKIVSSVYKARPKIHPATKTFQAIRIEVNDELRLLEKSIPLWLELLKPDGRIVVISFHSLEDRIVKEAFNEAANDYSENKIKILTKSPIRPSSQELAHNPRARSAKLRAAVKIKKKGN